MNVKFRLKQYMKMAVQNLFLPAVYQLYRNRPVQKDLVLFADAHHADRPESMNLLAEKLLKQGFQVEEMYLDYGTASAGQVVSHMLSFMKRYAQAGTVVICDNFLPAAGCRKKPETMLVQLWHACGALKRFGYDTTDDIPADYKGNVFAGIDLVTVSAPFCRKPFAGAMRLSEEKMQALGVSRTDRFFDPDWLETCRRRFEKQYADRLYVKQDDGAKAVRRKVVIWAPTFRGSPGNPDRLPFEPQQLQKQLGEEYLVLESAHPHMKQEGQKEQAGLTTEEMFASADVLIADYSSLIFEYCLVNRPLVLFTPDYEEYTAKRGFYMNYEEIPGRQVRQESQLAEAVRQAVSEGMDPLKRKQFLETYMSACDGHATERIAACIAAHRDE